MLWMLTYVHRLLRTAVVTKADIIIERARCSEEKHQDRSPEPRAPRASRVSVHHGKTDVCVGACG